MACMGGRVGVKNFRGVFACGERGGGVRNFYFGEGRLYYWGRGGHGGHLSVDNMPYR